MYVQVRPGFPDSAQCQRLESDKFIPHTTTTTDTPYGTFFAEPKESHEWQHACFGGDSLMLQCTNMYAAYHNNPIHQLRLVAFQFNIDRLISGSIIKT
jgi:hypothetical protein